MDQCYDVIKILIKRYPLRFSPGASLFMMIDEVITIQGNILYILETYLKPLIFKARKVGKFSWKEKIVFNISWTMTSSQTFDGLTKLYCVSAYCERNPVTFSWFLLWEKIFCSLALRGEKWWNNKFRDWCYEGVLISP